MRARAARRRFPRRRARVGAAARAVTPLAPAPDDPLRALPTRGRATDEEAQRERGFFLPSLAVGDSVVRTALSPALAVAIEAAVPSWRLRGPDPYRWDRRQLATPGFHLATPDAVVADLDRDGRLEAMLVGYRMAGARPAVDMVLDGSTGRYVPVARHGVRLPAVVLGVRTLRGADGVVRYDVRPLRARDTAVVFAAAEAALALAPDPPTFRAFATSDAGGQDVRDPTTRAALRRVYRFVRFADDDCFYDGGQWTVRAGRWVSVPAVYAVED